MASFFWEILGAIRELVDSRALLLWIVMIIFLLSIGAPILIRRFRSAASLIGEKKPADVFSFVIAKSKPNTQNEVISFATRSGYTIEFIDARRGLIALADPPRDSVFGWFFAIFLTEQPAGKTLVEVSIYSGFSGVMGPGTTVAWMDRRLEHFMDEIVSAVALGLSTPLAQQSDRPASTGSAKGSAMPGVGFVIWPVRIVTLLYVLVSIPFYLEALYQYEHENVVVTGKQYSVTSSQKTGRVDHYLLLVRSREWYEQYVDENAYARLNSGNVLDVKVTPWSRIWVDGIVTQTGERIAFRGGFSLLGTLVQVANFFSAAATLWFFIALPRLTWRITPRVPRLHGNSGEGPVYRKYIQDMPHRPAKL